MVNVIKYLPRVYKAIMAAVGAFSTAYALGRPDTPEGWLVLVAGAVATGLATWWARNYPAPTSRA